MPILYRTQASVSGGRNGHARTADGILDVTLSVPKEMGGPGKPATNPEQLFAAGYAACFDGAVHFLAGQKKIRGLSTVVTADVGVGPDDSAPGFALDVELTVAVSGLPEAEARALVAEAHRFCPYSKALSGNVPVRITVTAG
jgi:Ohr subfamily peroxiredoxin